MFDIIVRKGSAKAVQNGAILMTRRPRNYRIFAIILCAFFAWSLPGLAAPTPRAARASVRHSSVARLRVSSFVDSAKDDVTEYDDPVVRKAAVDALGRYNGSVVAIEPSSGRLL